MEVKVRDEYLHVPPSTNPLWFESYAFNGYDPVRKTGITVYTGISLVQKVRLETVALHSGDLLYFQNQEGLGKEDVLEQGSIRIKPLVPLREWRVQIANSFRKIGNNCSSHGAKALELDLHFNSTAPPYRFVTSRGDRYEQLGDLKGKARIEEKVLNFEGIGIRDHSWEVRNVPSWGEFYWLMGCFSSGEAVSVTCMSHDKDYFFHGWFRKNHYDEICSMQVNPVFNGDILRKCQIIIEYSGKRLEINLGVISSLSIPMELMSFVSLPTEQKQRSVMENLVELNGGLGHGFLWYGKQYD